MRSVFQCEAERHEEERPRGRGGKGEKEIDGTRGQKTGEWGRRWGGKVAKPMYLACLERPGSRNRYISNVWGARAAFEFIKTLAWDFSGSPRPSTRFRSRTGRG